MQQDSIYLILLYVVTLFLIIYFRRDEWMILSVLSVALVSAILLYKINILAVFIITLLFAIVENICAYYGIWKYNNAKSLMPYVPLWVYFAWALSIIFIIKMMEILKKNKLTF